MIKLKNVSKFYYSKGIIATGFSRVNLELNPGEFVVITGESGSGKSTLLNVLSGLETYEEGEMYIDGKETSHYIEKDWEDYRRKYIGNIYQNFNLINSYTVYQNIELVLTLNGIKKKDAKEKVIELIKRVNLYRFRNTKVSKLSGGQKQRVAIARALAKDIPIVIADEPTGSLDKKSALEVMKLLYEISKEKLVIIVTHNYEQVSEYATRRIVMHDGRVLEDKKLKEASFIEKLEAVQYGGISFRDKIKLGFRNTFNVLPKFILLLLVFSFVVIALMSEYATFKKEEFEASKSGANYVFQDANPARIVLNKKDRTPFSEEELEKLNKMENVDYLLKQDTLADEYTQLSTKEEDLWLGGYSKPIELFQGKLDVGKMPENANEIIILGSKNDYYLGSKPEELLQKEFYLQEYDSEDENPKTSLKVVGIKYLPKEDYSDFTLYFPKEMIDKLQFRVHQRFSTTKINFMGKNYDSTVYDHNFMIRTNANVPIGQAYISEDYNSYCEKERCLDKTLSIRVDNIYYKDEKTLTIAKTYNKNTIKNLLSLENYRQEDFEETYNRIIYINPEDYNTLYNKGTYQVSIYVKDINKLDSTLEELTKENYHPLAIKNTLVKGMTAEAMRILKIIITLVLVLVLFFISYFIVRLILKSRNIYFSIIRMLGGSRKVARQLLIIELFAVATISYFLFMLVIACNQIGMIHVEFISTIYTYFQISDYLILYFIITIMSYLISCRYASKLFKDSVMNTYREEV